MAPHPNWLLLIVRHFAECSASIPGFSFILFSHFQMESLLHGLLCRCSTGRRTTMCIINETPEIHFRRTTTLTPGQFVAGLTDFGPGRSKLFGNSADEYLKVHYLGRSEADVTEGSEGIWERLYYDWSNPNCVVLTTIDSNVWDYGSSYTYTFTRRLSGTTDIEVVLVRKGRNCKGRALGLVLRTIGRHVLQRAFDKSIKAIEARNSKLENHKAEPPHIPEFRGLPIQCACARTNNAEAYS